MVTTTLKERQNRRQNIARILRGPDKQVVEWLRGQHDSVLRDLIAGEWTSWQGNEHFDKPIEPMQRVRKLAKKVDENRQIASNEIRMVLARIFQLPDACTFSKWHILPCLTDKATIGFVNIADGAAFDSGVACPEEVIDLGLVSEVYAAINNGGGTVAFDGDVVQSEGTTVEGRKIIRPTMPPNWQQIVLPTWRGHNGDGYSRVPEEVYSADPIEPTQVAYGLRTCYGSAGKPCKFGEQKFGDLSFWKVDADQETELFQCVLYWTQEAVELLSNQMVDRDRQFESCRYPEQKLKRPALGKEHEIEQQEYALAEARGHASFEASKNILKNKGINCLWWSRDHVWPQQSTIGNREIDKLQALLSTMIFHRLETVMDSLRWMVSFPDAQRHYNFGPHKQFVQECLKEVAVRIGLVLLSELRDCRRVVDEMVEIHLADGPVYLN